MTSQPVRPHNQLEELAEGVWRVRGSLPFPMFRNMIVIRLPSGELVLHSVVALDDAGLNSLEALGRPAYAIVPSRGHQMDTAFYRARYPDLAFLAPEAVRPVVRVDVADTVEHALPALGFKVHPVPGWKSPECVYEYELPSGGRILISNDVFGGPDAHDHSRLLGRLLVRRMTVPGNGFGVTRITRWTMVSDKEALRRFARELADTPDLRLVTVSHGEPLTKAPAERLRNLIV